MAFTFFGEDINLNKNDLLLFKPHPTTTANRLLLGASLGVSHKGIFVTDVDENVHYWWDGIQWLPIGVDIKAKVSANDTTSGFLNGKLVSGTGISLVENNNGSNETLSIINTAPDQVVSLTAGTGINILGSYPNFTIHNLVTQYTDEMAQDAVGNILTDSSSVNFTYNDAANTITADVIGYNPTDWDTAFDKFPTAIAFTGTTTKTLNLTLNDGSVLSASFTDLTTSGGTGLSDAYVSMTDGTNVSSASGGDTFKFRSANSYITTTVADNNVTHGDNLLITFSEEALDDRVAALLVEGAGIDITYNDIAGSITIASTITQYTNEMAQDTIASMLNVHNGLTGTYNDGSNTYEVILGGNLDQNTSINGNFGMFVGNVIPLTTFQVQSALTLITAGSQLHLGSTGTINMYTTLSGISIDSASDLTLDGGTYVRLESGEFNVSQSYSAQYKMLVWDSTNDHVKVADWFDYTTFLTSESDPIALAKTITLNEGPGITISGSTSQTLNANPSWIISCDITQYTDEMAQDAVLNNITVHNGLTGLYDDSGDNYDIKLGGTLDEDTVIVMSDKTLTFDGTGANYLFVDGSSVDFHSENSFDQYKSADISGYTVNTGAGTQIQSTYNANTAGFITQSNALESRADIISTTGEIYMDTLTTGSDTDEIVTINSSMKVRKVPSATFLDPFRPTRKTFVVGALGSPLNDGETTFILTDCSGNPAINKEIEFIRERQEQYEVRDYTYDPATGSITLLYNAIDGQYMTFRIWDSSIWTVCSNITDTADIMLIDGTDELLVDGTDDFLV